MRAAGVLEAECQSSSAAGWRSVRDLVAAVLENVARYWVWFVAVGLISSWLPALRRSLWVDEAGTFWMARGGPLAAIQKTWHWPGQSILFSFITSFFCIGAPPLRDFFLRVPALAGAALAGYFVYRMAEDAIGERAGRVAAVLFVFSPPAIEFATEARPYSWAMAATAASCWTLYRWAESRERIWLAAYAVSSAAIVYFHYMFTLVFLAHLAFVVAEFGIRRRLYRAAELIAAVALAAALVAPIVPHILLVAREAHTLPFKSAPSIFELMGVVSPLFFAGGLFVAAQIIRAARISVRPAQVRVGTPTRALFFVWWCAGPLIVFALSSLTPMHVFLARYVCYSALAMTLLLTWMGVVRFGPRAGLVWALLGALLTTANPLWLFYDKPGTDELRPVMDLIRSASASAHGAVTRTEPPVLFRSELPESDFYDWRSGNSAGSYLFAGFAAYPMPNELIPLPYSLTPEVTAYVQSKIEARLRAVPRVLFVTHDAKWLGPVEDLFRHAGFDCRWTKPNAFYVAVFDRRGPGGGH